MSERLDSDAVIHLLETLAKRQESAAKYEGVESARGKKAQRWADQLNALRAALPGLLRDAERWRALAPTLTVCSTGPASGYYLSGEEFLDAPMPRSADEFADRRIAAVRHLPEGASQ